MWTGSWPRFSRPAVASSHESRNSGATRFYESLRSSRPHPRHTERGTPAQIGVPLAEPQRGDGVAVIPDYVGRALAQSGRLCLPAIRPRKVRGPSTEKLPLSTRLICQHSATSVVGNSVTTCRFARATRSPMWRQDQRIASVRARFHARGIYRTYELLNFWKCDDRAQGRNVATTRYACHDRSPFGRFLAPDVSAPGASFLDLRATSAGGSLPIPPPRFGGLDSGLMSVLLLALSLRCGRVSRRRERIGVTRLAREPICPTAKLPDVAVLRESLKCHLHVRARDGTSVTHLVGFMTPQDAVRRNRSRPRKAVVDPLHASPGWMQPPGRLDRLSALAS